jgi:sugar O-acyltransferase (sialic acid O-acetyltransferase NeuD family)
VVLDAILSTGMALPVCAVDPHKVGSRIGGVLVEGGDELLPKLESCGVTHFVMGIGGLGTSTLRPRLWKAVLDCGLTPLSVIHASALVSSSASIGAGAQILARAVVNVSAQIGSGSIVNTAAVVEHDCIVGSFCHLAPMSCLGGGVKIGDNSHLGIGAVVREYRVLGSGTLVGCGGALVSDLPDNSSALGVPAKVTRNEV